MRLETIVYLKPLNVPLHPNRLETATTEAAAKIPSRWNRASMAGGYQVSTASSNTSIGMGNQEDVGIVSWGLVDKVPLLRYGASTEPLGYAIYQRTYSNNIRMRLVQDKNNNHPTRKAMERATGYKTLGQ